MLEYIISLILLAIVVYGSVLAGLSESNDYEVYNEENTENKEE